MEIRKHVVGIGQFPVIVHSSSFEEIELTYGKDSPSPYKVTRRFQSAYIMLSADDPFPESFQIPLGRLRHDDGTDTRKSALQPGHYLLSDVVRVSRFKSLETDPFVDELTLRFLSTLKDDSEKKVANLSS